MEPSIDHHNDHDDDDNNNNNSNNNNNNNNNKQDAGFVGPPLNDEPYGSKVGWRENCVGSYISWTSDMDGLLVLHQKSFLKLFA